MTGWTWGGVQGSRLVFCDESSNPRQAGGLTCLAELGKKC